jgi:pectin-derived oligosaccharide transport system permease protein
LSTIQVLSGGREDQRGRFGVAGRLPQAASVPRRKSGDARAALGFLAPWALGLIFLTLGPLAFSLYLSFTRYNLFSAPQWIGFANYIHMFSDPNFLASAKVTLTYVAVSVPCVLISALAVALLLNTKMKGLAFYRTAFYIPTLLGGTVAISFLWTEVFSSTGVVNTVLKVFGIHGPPWLGDPGTALYTLISLNVWTFGGVMVIFMAGLRQIPRQLYEAARVDGAGWLTTFRRVTIPLLSPVIFFNGILTAITAFQSFTPAYIISGGTGGPINSTLLYSLYLYQQGFVQFNMGYAAAMAWFMVVVIAGLTAVAFATARFWVHYGDQ